MYVYYDPKLHSDLQSNNNSSREKLILRLKLLQKKIIMPFFSPTMALKNTVQGAVVQTIFSGKLIRIKLLFAIR